MARSPSPSQIPPTPLAAILVVTMLASLGTGVIWSGIFFIVEEEFAYTQRQSLWLSVVLGVTYIIGASSTGRVLRRLERRISPRAVLAGLLAVQSLVCLAPLQLRSEWSLWAVTIIATLLAAYMWPIVESYLTAGRHGPAMRSSIGYWNMVWMGAVAASLVLMAPLLRLDARLAIVGLGAANGLGLLVLPWFQPRPGTHDEHMSVAAVQREYPLLLRSAQALLPMSYLLSSAMAPLLPYRLEELGVDAFLLRLQRLDLELEISWKTPVAATWLLVRLLAAALMWRLPAWHGRWGTLLLGFVLLVAGFALVVLGPSIAAVLAGFGVFGAGMGVIYYAALYYAMAVGRAEVGASGRHEALIGAGYAGGPAVALLGVEGQRWLAPRHAGGAGIVIVTTLVAALGCLPALVHYARARRRRRDSATL